MQRYWEQCKARVSKQVVGWGAWVQLLQPLCNCKVIKAQQFRNAQTLAHRIPRPLLEALW